MTIVISKTRMKTKNGNKILLDKRFNKTCPVIKLQVSRNLKVKGRIICLNTSKYTKNVHNSLGEFIGNNALNLKSKFCDNESLSINYFYFINYFML